MLWSLAVAICFGLHWISDWYLLRFLGVREDLDSGLHFYDSFATLKFANCAKEIPIDERAPACGYIYGRLLLHLIKLFAICEESWMMVGWALLLSIAIVLGLLLGSLQQSSSALSVVAIVSVNSPPVLLLVERGNIDGLILSLLALSAWTMAGHRRGFSTLLLAF